LPRCLSKARVARNTSVQRPRLCSPLGAISSRERVKRVRPRRSDDGEGTVPKRRQRTIPHVELAIERDGERHVGNYFVERGMITVSYSKGGSKTTQVGGTPTESLATLLLTELVGESRRSDKP
jgi:hypothetical protein